MKEVLPASAAAKTIEIWFQDEARVGQQGSLEYIWAPIGSRPRAVRDNRHGSVYLFGALCAYRAVGAAIIMPATNTEAMNEHLKEISTQVAPGAHAVLVCDGAGWHQRVGKLRVPDTITLLSLPPYSPELNPLENVWDYLRGNELRSSRLEHLRGYARSLRQSMAIPDRRSRPDQINRLSTLGDGQRLNALVRVGAERSNGWAWRRPRKPGSWEPPEWGHTYRLRDKSERKRPGAGSLEGCGPVGSPAALPMVTKSSRQSQATEARANEGSNPLKQKPCRGFCGTTVRAPRRGTSLENSTPGEFPDRMVVHGATRPFVVGSTAARAS